MKQFFKYVLATIVGVMISSILVLIVIFSMIAASLSSLSPGAKDAVVPSNAVLYISLNHQVTEKTEPSPFEDLSIPGVSTMRSLGLNDIVGRIKAAKEDNNIKGIYLNLSTVNTGFASLRAIRAALVDFKESGKFIVSYGDGIGQKAYYLASVADEIYVSPLGSVDFRGLATSVMFMKDALDKLGVDMQVIKVGTYKSAVEPFTLNSMSAENRLQVTSYLNSIYDNFVSDIASSRGFTEEFVREVADGFLLQNANDAVEYKFVDEVLYKDELFAKIKEKLDIDQDQDIPSVSLMDYKKSSSESGARGDRIAVLYAYGDIVDGEAEEGQIGGESLSRELRKLRKDEKIKAIVLRVNSPGGSAMASDLIWREVTLAKEVKPVIVSMGDYAASGGYYISAAADSIFADASTITGSIGVFGLIPNLQRLFNQKLGIHFDAVKTGQYADMFVDADRPLTEEEKSIIQGSVNQIYQEFMQRVSGGRGMSIAQVDSIGQGRVWTGEQAVELGLVDRLATLDDAIKAAAGKAGLDSYRVMEYPRSKDPFASLFGASKEKIKIWFLEDELGEQVHYIKELRRVLQNTGIQARIPYSIEVY